MIIIITPFFNNSRKNDIMKIVIMIYFIHGSRGWYCPLIYLCDSEGHSTYPESAAVQAQVRGDGEAGEICFVFFSEGIISVSWTYIWVNYNDLTTTSLESWWMYRGIIPKWPYFRLVKYYNLPRYISIGFIYVYLKHDVSADWSFFSNFSVEWLWKIFQHIHQLNGKLMVNDDHEWVNKMGTLWLWLT
jgi:hypothetical protein